MVFLHFDVTAVVTFHTLIFNMISNIFHFIFKAYKALILGARNSSNHIQSFQYEILVKLKLFKIAFMSNDNISK